MRFGGACGDEHRVGCPRMRSVSLRTPIWVPRRVFGVATNTLRGGKGGVRCRYEQPPERKKYCSVSLRTPAWVPKCLFVTATNTLRGSPPPKNLLPLHPPPSSKLLAQNRVVIRLVIRQTI